MRAEQFGSKQVEKILQFIRFFGEPSGTRTRDPLIKSQMLYRPELTAHRGEVPGEFIILRAFLPIASGRFEGLSWVRKNRFSWAILMSGASAPLLG
jgi:hypothetical protein